jgi:hypothetical protein
MSRKPSPACSTPPRPRIGSTTWSTTKPPTSPRCSRRWGRSLDGSNAEGARAFDVLLDGRRIREDLGFSPEFPRLADALAAGA